jgi:hypothetical protein
MSEDRGKPEVVLTPEQQDKLKRSHRDYTEAELKQGFGEYLKYLRSEGRV